MLFLRNIFYWLIFHSEPVHRGVPQQAADGQVRVQDVPPQRVRRRRHLPRHPPEQG